MAIFLQKMKKKKKAERQAEMEPPKPSRPNPQPWPLRQVRIGGGRGGDWRPFDGIAATASGLALLPDACSELKHLMNLYKQMTAETSSAEWYNNISFSRHFPGQFQNVPRPLDVESQMAQPPSYPEHGFAVMRQYKKPNPVKTRGTCLVGGSTLGWNFITYPGKKSVYYGRTKESFRVAQSKLPKK